MRWKVRGERPIYRSPWVSLWLVDVELPDGRRFEHHVVRMAPVAATVVVDDQRRVLLLWRHRFITDTWGWEIPTGIVDEGEQPIETAAREVEEETGWRPGPLRQIVYTQPSNGISNSEHYLFRADGATYVGPPTDTTEADRIEWVPLSQVRSMIDRHEIVDGPTEIALLYTLVAEAEATKDDTAPATRGATPEPAPEEARAQA
jgi:8-oxo-dGTP pyrophosphatase MutT (NUDIX family)